MTLSPYDIRIGSWVLFRGQIVKVTGIGQSYGKTDITLNIGLISSLTHHPIYIEQLEGVELSVDILHKTNIELFLTHPYAAHFTFKGVNFFQTKKGFRMARSNRNINFLHELQSVVYWMTGEELTINL